MIKILNAVIFLVSVIVTGIALGIFVASGETNMGLWAIIGWLIMENSRKN